MSNIPYGFNNNHSYVVQFNISVKRRISLNTNSVPCKV